MIILSTGKFHQTKIIMFLVRAVQLLGAFTHDIFSSAVEAGQYREDQYFSVIVRC